MINKEQNPPIDEILKAGVVPILVAHLGNDSNPKLQFEAAWALTNIASGTTEQTMTIIRFVCYFYCFFSLYLNIILLLRICNNYFYS